MSSFSDKWNKLKSYWKDTVMQIPFFKVVFNPYFLVGLLFVVWIVALDRNSVVRWVQTEKKVDELQKQKTYYKESIDAADEKLKELKSNKDSLEKFAREQYFFHEDGEDVYVFDDSSDKK
jgi:cell division protein DivIC